MWKYTPLIRLNHKLGVQFPIFFLLKCCRFALFTRRKCWCSLLYVQHSIEGAAWEYKECFCGCGRGSKVDLMDRVQQLLGRAHLSVCSALLDTAKLHQTQQLTGLRHKTWQQPIRPNLWSDNPICGILSFFSVEVDILRAKLISCCFSIAALRHHLLIKLWSIGYCDVFASYFVLMILLLLQYPDLLYIFSIYISAECSICPTRREQTHQWPPLLSNLSWRPLPYSKFSNKSCYSEFCVRHEQIKASCWQTLGKLPQM